jgi:exonuclease SbcD
MKFLHTADWHLGQNFFQHNRDEEFRHFFDCLRRTVRTERPDALLVAGDIFDTALPGVEAQQLYYDAVVSLHEACPTMQILIIAGNHDSASRLEAPNRLWQALNVTVVGTLARQGGVVDYARHIFPIRREGQEVGYVVALPHTYVGNLPRVEPPSGSLFDDEGCTDDYAARVFQLLKRLRHVVVEMRSAAEQRQGRSAVEGHLPILLMAHLTAVGSQGGEAWQHGVGGKEALPVAPLAQLFDYVALGHIHHPAPLSGAENVRYAGAPIPISFEETYPHGVLIGEIADGALRLRREEYPTLIPVRRVPEQPMKADEALPLLADFPADEVAYVQANILQDGPPQPDLRERIRLAFEGKQARFCDVKFTYPERPEAEVPALQVRDMSELRAVDPLKLAQIYYEEKTGTPMSDAQVALMNQIIAEVQA